MSPIDRKRQGGERGGSESKEARGFVASVSPSSSKAQIFHRACAFLPSLDRVSGATRISEGSLLEPCFRGIGILTEQIRGRAAHFETTERALSRSNPPTTISTI
jgi:hypothetical protein